jgi:hypothetical protein
VDNIDDLSDGGVSENDSKKRKIFSIMKGDEALYTANSNTIFYYGSYRVVIVLDLSRSTFVFSPSQRTNSYVERV